MQEDFTGHLQGALQAAGTTIALQDVANVSVFLASDAASFVTSQTVSADGSWTMI